MNEPDDIEISPELRFTHGMIIARYFASLRRDPLRGRYVNARMEIEAVLVNALPLPLPIR